ncbi:MAG: T9SS type A sorting domain-containing protein [Flavobacteriales bacterium]
MKILILLILILISSSSSSQSWESLDGGLECNEPSVVSTILGLNYDETLNQIDAYGYFKNNRQCQPFRGLGYWDGLNWMQYPDACLLGWNRLLDYDGNKYAVGGLSCETWDRNLYLLDDGEWSVISSVPELYGVSFLAEISQRFYIATMLATDENEEVPLLLEYDPDINDYTIVAKRLDFSLVRMADIVNYNDTMFLGGKFNCYNFNLPENRINCLAKVEDETIVQVGHGLDGGSNVYSLCIHQDTLFIGGIFEQQNFPGFTNEQYIFLLYYFNGELKPYHIQTNGYVTSLVSNEDILYVGGFFTETNDETCYGVFAIDNGEMIWKNTEQFMSVDGVLIEEFSESVYDMLVVDDHLYIAGRFEYIGQDGPYGNIAKLSTPLSEVSRVVEDKLEWEMKLYPNPADEYITLEIPLGAKGSLQIFNNLGQLVHQEYILQPNSTVVISHLPPNIYSFCFQTNRGLKTERVLVR